MCTQRMARIAEMNETERSIVKLCIREKNLCSEEKCDIMPV